MDSRHIPLHLVCDVGEMDPRASWMLGKPSVN